MPKFPGPERERFWRAWAGCLDPTARPETTIPWTDVSEIKAGNWVLYFKLTRKVTLGSDGGKRKDLDEITVNLHGRRANRHSGRRKVRIASRKASPKSAAFFAPTP
jgi:hypothetical protein